jgi:hypothetical protein
MSVAWWIAAGTRDPPRDASPTAGSDWAERSRRSVLLQRAEAGRLRGSRSGLADDQAAVCDGAGGGPYHWLCYVKGPDGGPPSGAPGPSSDGLAAALNELLNRGPLRPGIGCEEGSLRCRGRGCRSGSARGDSKGPGPVQQAGEDLCPIDLGCLSRCFCSMTHSFRKFICRGVLAVSLPAT